MIGPIVLLVVGAAICIVATSWLLNSYSDSPIWLLVFGLLVLGASFVWALSKGDEPCLDGEVRVQDSPIYVKSGNVMVPIDRSHCEVAP